MIDLSIVIVTYNSSAEIINAINSIYEFAKELKFEIIIVDNNSSDDTVSLVKSISHDEIVLISNHANKGFAYANNQGFDKAQGKYILIYNPDLVLTAESHLPQLIKILEHMPHVGVVAPRLYYSNGTIQESARGFPNPLAQMIRVLRLDKFFSSSNLYSNYMINVERLTDDTYVDWVIGAFMLTRKSTLYEVKFFDAGYFMYLEDTDLCLRLKNKGFKILYSPRFSAIHTYKRESSKKIISKLKLIHLMSSVRFHWKYIRFWLRHRI